ncbi:DUF2087 domain-containing protein [Micromonospora sp. PLK6-60]|uniref:DUF2087 domain-containing protein n=1 Tax=Micromonospora sp. PLK6-60 TaxID=2873383 RepID=UPI0021057DE1|nr:DUF2087 domain-containing protein [Micromonospora sp. PLK6-60]
MSADVILRSIADPRRLRAFAAVVLGARSTADIAEATGLSPREAAVAGRRLQEAGLVESDGAGLRPAYEKLRAVVADDGAVVTEADLPRPLRPFVRDGRLVSMPAGQSKRRALLEHLTEVSFDADAAYCEREVDDRLRRWCEGSSVDHVSVRRYLVEAEFLVRAGGVYARDRARLPAANAAEQHVAAMGLR